MNSVANRRETITEADFVKYMDMLIAKGILEADRKVTKRDRAPIYLNGCLTKNALILFANSMEETIKSDKHRKLTRQDIYEKCMMDMVVLSYKPGEIVTEDEAVNLYMYTMMALNTADLKNPLLEKIGDFMKERGYSGK